MIGKGKTNVLRYAWLPAALLCVAGCATNGGTTTTTTGTTGTSTTFSAADLKGTYVFSASGSNTDDGNYAVLGSFVADGIGKITSGEADYNFGSGVDSAVMLTGTFAVNGTGTAVIAITDGVAVQDNITVTLVKSGVSTITGYGLNGTGSLTPATFSGFTPGGTYTYTVAGTGQGVVTSSGTFSTIGTGVISGGTNTYTDNGHTTTQTSNVGFVGMPNAVGRSYASIAGHTYAIYLISPTSMALIGLDEDALLTGTATKM